jgi:hypothetical protein
MNNGLLELRICNSLRGIKLYYNHSRMLYVQYWLWANNYEHGDDTNSNTASNKFNVDRICI